MFIITQDEPFFIGKVIRGLLGEDAIEIVGATVLTAKRLKKSRLDFVRERCRVYTGWELAWVTFAYLTCRLLRRGPKASLKELGVPLVQTKDVNDRVYIKQVRALKPDVILSISPPQIFGRELLESAPQCINAHASLLPRHRGVFGTWWTLFTDDREAGLTLHRMVEKIDGGDTYVQYSVPVAPDDTQFSLAYKTKRLVVPAVMDYLGHLENGAIKPLSPAHDPTYNYAPTSRQVKKFREMGKRVFKFADLPRMLSRDF